MATDREIILGIDLGTTNSLVAVVENETPKILPDGESSLIPSVVAFDTEGRVSAVGHRAKSLKSLDPARVLYSVKRLMGRGKEDLGKIAAELPFDFSDSTGEMIRIKVAGRSITPIEVSAEILKRCRFVAENQLGKKISKAVVTVPAYFNEAQRTATAVAGRIAGLEVLRILNEPTAAALAYGLDRESQSRKIAVYDFGGGTFDVSILKVTDGVFEVLSTDGDTELGGDDLDAAIYTWLSSKIGKFPAGPEDFILCMSQIESLKKSLSENSEIHFRMHWAGRLQWEGVITREEIDQVMRGLVEKSIFCCDRALRASKLSKSEIDDVVLVGGSTRVPLVRDMVAAFFQKTPNSSLNPEEVVALGAAIQASVLAGQSKASLLLDVVPLSLGLETIGGLVTKLIPRNTTIPCLAKEAFTTSVDNQTGVDLHVLQGEREFVKDCRSLGRFKLKIDPQPAGIPKIEVSFMMDANGLLRVQAKDLKTSQLAEVEVRPSFGLSDEQVEQILTDSWNHAEQDFQSRIFVETQQQAEALIRITEKSLQSPLLDEVARQEFEKELRPIIKALQEDIRWAGVEIIKTRTQELDHKAQDLANALVTKALQQNFRLKAQQSAG